MKSLEGCQLLQILTHSLIVGLLTLGAITPSYAQSTDLPPLCGQTCSSSSNCTDFCNSSCEVIYNEGEITDIKCVVSTCGESATCGGTCDEVCEANCGKLCTDRNGFTQQCPECSGGGGGGDGGGDGGGPISLTSAGRTWQSSTAFGGTSNRAVDLNIDGNYWNGSVTHTAVQDNPEWGVWIRPGRVWKIIIWNRTDCCGERLSGANVWLRRFNDHKWDRVATLKGNQAQYDIRVPNFNSRVASDAVAIVRDGRAQVLSLAEISVMGWSIGP